MKILICIWFCIIFGCKSPTDCEKNVFLNEYTKGDFSSELPPLNMQLIMVIKTIDNKILLTSNYLLYKVYSTNFKSQFKNFEDFVCLLVSAKFLIQSNMFKEDVTIEACSESVKTIYEANNLEGIFSKYFISSHLQDLRLKKNLNNPELYTVLYYMFINKYHISYSDYAGVYKFRKSM